MGSGFRVRGSAFGVRGPGFQVRGPEFRRAVAYVVPYWRRLALVVALSGVSTALSLALPYLSKTLIDTALVGRNLTALYRIVAMIWLDVRLALVAFAMVPVSVWALSRVRATLAERVRSVREAGAAIGSFLIETLQAVRLVVTSNAQSREVDAFRRRNTAFVDALMSMQLWSY